MWLPVSSDHSLTILSKEPEAMSDPSGETATARAALAEFRRRLPSYTIGSFRNEGLCANDLCRAQRERYYAGLAKAGLPE